MNEIYVADFETSTKNNKTWVWVFGLSNIKSNKKPVLGGSIKEFFEKIQTCKDKKIYFHNLKFDGSFLLTYLLSNNYVQCERCQKAGEFSALIDEQGNFYNIIYIFNKNDKDYKIEFLDSAKLFPDTLRNLAITFGLPVQKGELDYEKVRYENHKLTQDEEKYIINDVVILRECINIAINRGMNKMTIGSNALQYYKDMVSKKGVTFEQVFPKLTEDEYTFIEKAYKGGCSMLKHTMRNKITPTIVYDINNMYGSILQSKPMPYGKPIYYKGKYKKDDKYNLFIQHITCEFAIKENCPPCIQIKNNPEFLSNEWVEYSLGIVDLYLTNMDMKLLFDNYNIYHLKYIDGYKFMSGTKFFCEYINYWYDIKVNGNGVDKKIAKLYNNSLYGKFGTKPLRNNVYFKLENGVLKRDKLVESKCKTIYAPVAVFTTSYGREMIISAAKKTWDKFIYCDTDSLHLTSEVNNIDIDNKKLGYFKLEEKGIGKYLKQKTYIIDLNKEYWEINEFGELKTQKIVCAGLNKMLLPKRIELKDFNIGIKLKKIVAKKIKGGVTLTTTEHEITAPIFSEHTKNGGGI